MGCVTFELIKKVWNIMLASQAYMKDRSVLQIHNSFWGQSKFIVAYEFFKVGIFYIFFFRFIIPWYFSEPDRCLCLKFGAKIKGWQTKKIGDKI